MRGGLQESGGLFNERNPNMDRLQIAWMLFGAFSFGVLAGIEVGWWAMLLVIALLISIIAGALLIEPKEAENGK